VTIEEPAEKTRLKKNGKPSRRWLSREMESMRMELAEMAKKLKEKEDRSANWVDGELTILAPLLVAYEENVREKSRLVQEAKDDMAQMTSNIKDLVAENESLRQSITESQTKSGTASKATAPTEASENEWFQERRAHLGVRAGPAKSANSDCRSEKVQKNVAKLRKARRTEKGCHTAREPRRCF
ncbi:unnamed protein product, partial [Nesidiocoris tenuis]